MASGGRAGGKRLPPGPTAPSSSSSSYNGAAGASGGPAMASSSTTGLSNTSHTYAPSTLDELLSQNGLHRYQLAPPSWRAPWLARPPAAIANDSATQATASSTSYPQFYPTCDGQDEDQLTEQAVKSGYPSRVVVPTETFSAHQLIYEKLKTSNILSNLSKLGDAVLARQRQNLPTFDAFAFKLPKRAMLSDHKRELWLNDLANSAVPLSKLYPLIPNVSGSLKDTTLLENMYKRRVPLARAVWFIRASGASEIQHQVRMKAAGGHVHSAAAITANFEREWTAALLQFVSKQLQEISMDAVKPSAPSTDARRRVTDKRAVMTDASLRAEWTSRFSWSLKLLEMLYEEHLLDGDAFLRFIVKQIETSNIGQLPFALFLAEEFVGEFFAFEPLAGRLVACSLTRLVELNSSSLQSTFIAPMTSSIIVLVRTIFLSLPDAFISSPLWRTSVSTIEKALLELDEPALKRTIKAELVDLETRHSAASKSTEDEDSTEPDDLDTIQALDSIAYPASLSTCHKTLFHKRRRKRPLQVELPIMFSWATTNDRNGPHRRYAVAALLKMERDEHSLEDGQGLTPSDAVETTFIEWIDKQATSGGSRRGSEDDIRLLFEELIRVGVLSFSLYLQRMIARGETEFSRQKTPSIHLTLLKTVALQDIAGALQARRRVALRAVSSTRVTIDQAVQELIQDVSRHVPTLIGLPPLPTDLRLDDEDCSGLFYKLDNLSQQGQHLPVTRRFILQGVGKVSRSALDGTLELSRGDFALLSEIYLRCGDFVGLHEFLVLVLESHPSPVVLSQIIEACTAYGDVWAAMNALPSFAVALLGVHKDNKSSSAADRRMLSLLRQLAAEGHLDQASAETVEQDCQEVVLSLSSTQPQSQGLPSTLPEVQSLVVDHSPHAIAQLGTRLWYRYHNYESWGATAFESVVRLLAQVPLHSAEAFLREMNDRLAGGLEPQIGKWVSSLSCQALVIAFGGPISSSLTTLLADLTNDQTLSAPALLALVIVPAWKTLLCELVGVVVLSSVESKGKDHGPVDPVLLQSLDTFTTLFALLATDVDVAATINVATPANLVCKQRSICRRAPLYSQHSLATMAQCLSLLVIHQDVLTNSTTLNPLDQSRNVAMLTMSVMNCEWFQASIRKSPQDLAANMLDSPLVSSVPAIATFRPKLLAAVLLALKDGSTASPASLVSTEDWDTFLSGLTIWRLSVSKIEVQACLERLRLDSSLSEESKADALHTLSIHFLDRVCSGKGHTYLGEQVVKCYHGDASNELVSVAFGRVAEAFTMLTGSADKDEQTTSQALTTLRCVGRVLNTLLQSAHATCRLDALRQLLSSIKQCLETLLTTSRTDDDYRSSVVYTDAILHCSHLLAIGLRCADAKSTAGLGDLLVGCLVAVVKLAISLSKQCWVESDLTTILLDTSACLLFTINDGSIAVPPLHALVTDEFEVDVLPDSTVTRLTRLFGPSTMLGVLSSINVNPWELLDYAESSLGSAGAGTATSISIEPSQSRLNVGPIDVRAFDAQIVEVIPKFTALDAMSSRSSSTNTPQAPAVTTTATSTTNAGQNNLLTVPTASTSLSSHPHSSPHLVSSVGGNGGTRRGLQSNFDFETPCVGMSVAAKDHRRTINSAKSSFVSKFDPLASKKAAMAAVLLQQQQQQQQQAQQAQQAQQIQQQPQAQPQQQQSDSTSSDAKKTTKVTSAAAAAAASLTGAKSSNGASGGAGTKRKPAPDLLVISDDDDDDAQGAAVPAVTVQPPAAKKAKTSSGTSARGKGNSRRKSKGG
ncbi:hypothetical protein ACM66B_000077 [Microbotryomycetes sp. NB124-2]